LVWAGEAWNLPWLIYADAIAGLIVAAIILWVGSRLGMRTPERTAGNRTSDLVLQKLDRRERPSSSGVRVRMPSREPTHKMMAATNQSGDGIGIDQPRKIPGFAGPNQADTRDDD